MTALIKTNLTKIQKQINDALIAVGRAPGEVRLLLASKRQSLEKIQAAIAAGQFHFGESQVQEALSKISMINDAKVVWHFIGAIQSNKTKAIAENFSWVHGLASAKHAQRLSDQRPESLAPLNVCIQINVDNEPSKAGVSLAEVVDLAEEIKKLKNLKLRSLMCISAPANSAQTFQKVQSCFDELNKQGFQLDTLSMGM